MLASARFVSRPVNNPTISRRSSDAAIHLPRAIRACRISGYPPNSLPKPQLTISSQCRLVLEASLGSRNALLDGRQAGKLLVCELSPVEHLQAGPGNRGLSRLEKHMAGCAVQLRGELRRVLREACACSTVNKPCLEIAANHDWLACSRSFSCPRNIERPAVAIVHRRSCDRVLVSELVDCRAKEIHLPMSLANVPYEVRSDRLADLHGDGLCRVA